MRSPDARDVQRARKEINETEKLREVARKRVDEAKNEVKANLLQEVGRAWNGSAREWFDACVVLDAIGLPAYSFHLGSGGNEGNQDYTAGFQRNLTLVLQANGEPVEGAAERLRSLLFGESARVLDRQAAGQFSPGRAGGTNMGAGFFGGAAVNPWEFVLMLEGAVALVTGMSRRGEVGRARVSSPFWVEAASAGFGSASEMEGSPRGEQWLPLWSRPLQYGELVELIREGRAQVGSLQTTRAGDIVRAAARLGLARGIESLQRFAYLERNGQSNLAVSAGRFRVASRSHQVLLEEVAPWIDRLVWYARRSKDNNVPPSLGAVARRTQEALFAVCRHDATPMEWRELLVALGDAELALLRSGKNPARRPLPRLSSGWIAAADDGTAQGRTTLRLALALASQHDPPGKNDPTLRDSVRQHFIPVEDADREWPRFRLDDRGRAERDPEYVCLGRDLVTDAIALVRRRSIWARRSTPERDRARQLPLWAPGSVSATIEEIGAWVRGELSDDAVYGLARPLLALDWTKIVREGLGSGLFAAPVGEPEPLHMLFRLAHLPFDIPVEGSNDAAEAGVTVRLDPEPLRRLAAGDLDGALRVAVRRLGASGLRPVFRRGVGRPGMARRLAASLAFPISRHDAARASRLVCKPFEAKAEEPLSARA
jgi:CRISPR-associated protein Csx17